MCNETKKDACENSDFRRFISRTSFLTPEHIVLSGWLEHAAFAFWLAETLTPRTFVELGSHSGYSYFSFCQIVSKLELGTSCYAVDTWQGDEHAGFYDQTVYESVVALNSKYKSFSTLIRSTFGAAVSYFPDQSVDLLHIDGRHFYDDVKSDFETWKPKLTRDAIVLFHDTNVRERDFGVWQLFGELKSKYTTFEFLHGHGLGILAIGEIPPPLGDLFSADIYTADDIRSIYSQLGANLSARWLAKEHDRLVRELATTVAANHALRIDMARQSDVGERQRERIDILFEQKDDLTHRAETAEAALQSIATDNAFLAPRILGGMPLAKQTAKVLERVRTSRTFGKKADAELASKIRDTGLFEDNYYRANNPHVAVSGIDPALHFVVQGWKEGCRPTALFDPLFYIRQNPDSLNAGENPLLHFADVGWKAGRQPSADFDLAFYLQQNPEVAEAGVNPLVHYLQTGRREGRRTLPATS